MDFTKLLTSTPIDGTAKRVIQRGFHHEVKVKPGDTETWDAPPPSKGRPKAAPDITGFRRGWLTAFRYHDTGKNGSKWLVRCDCGTYEVRSAARWVSKPDLPDACTRCRAMHFVKHGHSFGSCSKREGA